ncbi:RidA family protein [Mesorhizobium sp. 1B3]|uniref:RidA family protein n=1 Tax=Mesorhizobium sp. 1B3 TaxID=3243599 RepID=UPI003D9847F7
MTIERSGSLPFMHRAVKHNGTLYLGGVTASDFSADIAGQTREMLGKVEALLDQNGSSKRHMLTALIFLSNMADKDGMNGIWGEWLDVADMPGRATVGVADLGKDCLIEISVTAALRA